MNYTESSLLFEHLKLLTVSVLRQSENGLIELLYSKEKSFFHFNALGSIVDRCCCFFPMFMFHIHITIRIGFRGLCLLTIEMRWPIVLHVTIFFDLNGMLWWLMVDGWWLNEYVQLVLFFFIFIRMKIKCISVSGWMKMIGDAVSGAFLSNKYIFIDFNLIVSNVIIFHFDHKKTI